MTPKQSRIISKVLSPACAMWLRSQVSHVEDLQVNVEGGDRQILTGYIPRVSLSAHRAVYQGLHLSQVQLTGENIRINLGQVLQGKPLSLLEPVPVSGQALLEEADLGASLQSPLLSVALTDLLGKFVTSVALVAADAEDARSETSESPQINWKQVAIDTDALTLGGTYRDAGGNTAPFLICTSLRLAGSHELRFDRLQIQMPPHSPPVNLDTFELDLGSEVYLKELTLAPRQIVCRGCLTASPANH